MKEFITLFIVLFSVTNLYCQNLDFDQQDDIQEEEISRVHFFEGNFSFYAPLDAFLDKIDKGLLVGFSVNYLRQLQKEKPSFLGLEVFHMNLGSHSENYDAVVGSEQLVLSGKVASNALGLNLIYRYYVPFRLSRFEPYVETQLGTKWMYSYLTESGSFIDDEVYENFDFLTNTWVITYGGAVGFQIHIADIYYLNLKTSYHFAVSGEYEIKNDGDLSAVEFPEEAFETVQSATNFVKFDIGFTILF